MYGVQFGEFVCGYCGLKGQLVVGDHLTRGLISLLVHCMYCACATLCIRRAFNDNTHRKFSFSFPRGPYSEKTSWFDSSKRPLKLRIWSGRLRKVRLYRSVRAVTFSNLHLR